MAEQTRSWQMKYLATHPQDHKNIMFYPQTTLPPAKRESIFSKGEAPIGYPGRWIPCIPIESSPEGSRRIADMLCYLLKLAKGLPWPIEPVLTDKNTMNQDSAKYYDWREDVILDVICFVCGSIEQVGHTVAERDGEWVCQECLDTGKLEDFYAVQREQNND